MHLHGMSFFTAQHHVPEVPSCLNPFAPPRRRRPSFHRGRLSMSPSERLLRRKAAEAWKHEIIYRQVAEYEQRAIQTIEGEEGQEYGKVVAGAEPETRCRAEADWDKMVARRKPYPHPCSGPYSVECGLDGAESLPLGRRDRPETNRYLPIPGLRFLTTKRLLRFMEFWRVFAPRGAKRMWR